MKKLLIILMVSFAYLTATAQVETVTAISDTVTDYFMVGKAETVMIKADLYPTSATRGTYDTLILSRNVNGSNQWYSVAGDTIVVTDSATNVQIKTYTSNYFERFKYTIYTDTTPNKTFKFFVEKR